MNNIVIGIVANPMDIDNKSYECIVRNNLKYLDNKCSYIGIIQFDKNGIKDSNVLDGCDGIIFQGGNYIYSSFYDILDYAIQKNIPVLGICMGMQLMGLYANKQVEDDLIKVDKHNNSNHIIRINENSVLGNLYGRELLVNSRHNYMLDFVNEPFVVSAKSEDGVIEAIEWIDENHFLIGVQFHPEDLDTTEKLYNYFIKECLKRKKMKEL